MNAEKTQWVGLNVTMSDDLRKVVHETCRMMGTSASAWARGLILDALPSLLEASTARKDGVERLFSRKIFTGDALRAGKRKRGDAVRAKAREAKAGKAFATKAKG